jgi:thymidylate synthase
MTNFDETYINLCKKVLEEGSITFNERTKKRCITYFGDLSNYDLSDGYFPLLTTKKMSINPIVAELLGFIRGYDNAAQFREAGTKIWDANANVSKHWLANPNRRGEDDLGRIYGVQARSWQAADGGSVDQLKSVIDRLSARNDDRRLIVTHWNPAEIDQMALAPCHLMYMFGIEGDKLNISMIQRSMDVPLGCPYNIASYALLLLLVCRITGFKPGKLAHFGWNIHIYQDQVEGMRQQITRHSCGSPKLIIDESIKTLDDLETWVKVEHFQLVDYKSHPAIVYPFSE